MATTKTRKKSKGTSPTRRTLKILRDSGYTAEVVERFNHYTKTRHDLWGCLDVLAMGEDKGILGVQATAAGVSSRVAKIVALEEENGQPGRWLRSGGRLEVWGFATRRSREKNADGSRSAKKEVRRRVIVFSWGRSGLVSVEHDD